MELCHSSVSDTPGRDTAASTGQVGPVRRRQVAKRCNSDDDAGSRLSMTPVYRQIRTGGEAHMVRFRVYVQDGPRVRIPNNTERVRRLPKWPFSFFPSVFSADAGPSAGTSIEAAVSRIACSVCSG